MNKTRTYLLLALFTFLIQGLFGAFENPPADALGAATGQALVSVSGGTAFLVNPANLDAASNFEMDFTFLAGSTPLDKVARTEGALSARFKSHGKVHLAAAVGMTRYPYSGTYPGASGTSLWNESQVQAVLTYSSEKFLAIGIAGKLLTSGSQALLHDEKDKPEVSGNFDLGLRFFRNNFSSGIALINLMDTGVNTTRKLQAGISLSPVLKKNVPGRSLRLAMDLSLIPVRKQADIHLGAIAQINRRIALNFGFIAVDLFHSVTPSIGLRLDLERLDLSYAWQYPMPFFGAGNHVLGLGFAF